jgi:hypothetical protein
VSAELPRARPREPAALALEALLPGVARGPRRDGVYALWLTVRVALDFSLSPPLPERAARRRVVALERRLASLTLPAPLRRALSATVAEMRNADPVATAVALAQLVAPARETLGSDAGDAIAQAARVARTSAP